MKTVFAAALTKTVLAGTRALFHRPGLALIILLCLANGALGDPPRAHQVKENKYLASWQELYFRWLFGDVTLPVDHNGNATANGVALVPIPPTPGDGTPGHQEVVLDANQRWVLPLLALPGTSYSDGTPNDPLVPLRLFESMEISLRVDGETIVSQENLMKFYYATMLDPVIPYDAPPIAAIIWFQGIGLAPQPPFSPGTHMIELDLRTTEPLPAYFGGGFVEYHNTWAVTVPPKEGTECDEPAAD